MAIGLSINLSDLIGYDNSRRSWKSKRCRTNPSAEMADSIGWNRCFLDLRLWDWKWSFQIHHVDFPFCGMTLCGMKSCIAKKAQKMYLFFRDPKKNVVYLPLTRVHYRAPPPVPSKSPQSLDETELSGILGAVLNPPTSPLHWPRSIC